MVSDRDSGFAQTLKAAIQEHGLDASARPPLASKPVNVTETSLGSEVVGRASDKNSVSGNFRDNPPRVTKSENLSSPTILPSDHQQNNRTVQSLKRTHDEINSGATTDVQSLPSKRTRSKDDDLLKFVNDIGDRLGFSDEVKEEARKFAFVCYLTRFEASIYEAEKCFSMTIVHFIFIPLIDDTYLLRIKLPEKEQRIYLFIKLMEIRDIMMVNGIEPAWSPDSTTINHIREITKTVILSPSLNNYTTNHIRSTVYAAVSRKEVGLPRDWQYHLSKERAVVAAIQTQVTNIRAAIKRKIVDDSSNSHVDIQTFACKLLKMSKGVIIPEPSKAMWGRVAIWRSAYAKDPKGDFWANVDAALESIRGAAAALYPVDSAMYKKEVSDQIKVTLLEDFKKNGYPFWGHSIEDILACSTGRAGTDSS